MQPSAQPNKATVLVVEDDPSISLGLRINLEAEGYAVHVADDGEKALEEIRTGEPDIVILDLMLPSVNGFEVIQIARREGHTMPIIVLSARTGEMDKVTGLELGAEDFVSKPFSLAELLARVRGALRRAGPKFRPVVAAPRSATVFGKVRVDPEARTVHKDDVTVEFTATEFDVLMCLLRARGKVLTREEIFRAVWGPNHHGTPRTIDNFLQQLRAKLEDDPQEPKHFLTVRGVGYRFDA